MILKLLGKAGAYLMYDRPILEYAAVVWAPHTCEIERLEAVQRWAARFVISDCKCTSSVAVMLHIIQNSLSRRQTSRLYLQDLAQPS